jgi:hypothetical protein
MVQFVGISHDADSLDLATGDVELDHTHHASFAVMHHGTGLAVDPGKPKRSTRKPAPAQQPGHQLDDALPSGQWSHDRLRLAAAVRMEHYVGCEHAKQSTDVPASGGLEESPRQFLAFRASGRGRRNTASLGPGGEALHGPGDGRQGPVVRR